MYSWENLVFWDPKLVLRGGLDIRQISRLHCVYCMSLSGQVVGLQALGCQECNFLGVHTWECTQVGHRTPFAWDFQGHSDNVHLYQWVLHTIMGSLTGGKYMIKWRCKLTHSYKWSIRILVKGIVLNNCSTNTIPTMADANFTPLGHLVR